MNYTTSASRIDWNLAFEILVQGLVLLAKASYLAGVAARHGYEALKAYVCHTLEQSQVRLTNTAIPQHWAWVLPLFITLDQALKPLTQALLRVYNSILQVLTENPTAEPSDQGFEGYSVKELRVLAAQFGIKNCHKFRKQELIEQLRLAISQ
jgi:hypothetical protein